MRGRAEGNSPVLERYPLPGPKIWDRPLHDSEATSNTPASKKKQAAATNSTARSKLPGPKNWDRPLHDSEATAKFKNDVKDARLKGKSRRPLRIQLQRSEVRLRWRLRAA